METASLNNCFGCGKDNTAGLHLKNSYKDNKSHIDFEVKNEFCGHPGLLHGGIIGILFDEVMFHAIAQSGIEVVTLNMNVNYKNPAFEGDHLCCEGWMEKRDGRRIDVAAVITSSRTGKIIAEGMGKFLEVDLKEFLTSGKM